MADNMITGSSPFKHQQFNPASLPDSVFVKKGFVYDGSFETGIVAKDGYDGRSSELGIKGSVGENGEEHLRIMDKDHIKNLALEIEKGVNGEGVLTITNKTPRPEVKGKDTDLPGEGAVTEVQIPMGKLDLDSPQHISHVGHEGKKGDEIAGVDIEKSSSGFRMTLLSAAGDKKIYEVKNGALFLEDGIPDNVEPAVQKEPKKEAKKSKARHRTGSGRAEKPGEGYGKEHGKLKEESLAILDRVHDDPKKEALRIGFPPKLAEFASWETVDAVKKEKVRFMEASSFPVTYGTMNEDQRMFTAINYGLPPTSSWEKIKAVAHDREPLVKKTKAEKLGGWIREKSSDFVDFLDSFCV